jgi:DNA polymerase-3 subunit delta
MNYLQLKQSISQGKLAPVYLLYGEESYLIDDMLKRIERQVLGEGVRDFGYQLFYGEEAQAADIINAALTVPMLAAKKGGVVKNLQNMNAAQLKKLSAYAAQPASTAVLILTGDKLDGKKAWLKSMESLCTAVRFYPLYDRDALSWIKLHVQEAGYRIDPDAAHSILELSGSNLATLVNQLEKLFAYTASEKRISLDDVESVAGRVKQHNIFELVDAIGNKRLERALYILAEIMAHGESPAYVMALISRQLRLIWKAKDSLAQGDSWDKISRKLKIQRFFLKSFRSQVERFSLKELDAAFHHLLATDMRLKSGTQLPRLTLEALLLNLCY